MTMAKGGDKLYSDGPTFTMHLGASRLSENLCTDSASQTLSRKTFGKNGVNTRLAVTHRNTIQIHSVSGEWIEGINFKHDQNIQLLPPRNIIAANWVSVSGVGGVEKSLLVVATDVDVLFYTDTGSMILSKHVWDKLVDGCSRVFASLGSKIYMANAKGDVVEFMYKAVRQPEVLFHDRSDGLHSAPIYCMNIVPELMATGDYFGTVSIWRMPGYEKWNVFKTETEQCVTKCLFCSHYLLASYGTGTIRIYDYKKGRLHAKIDAHSQWISAMELCLTMQLLMTVSEDNYVRIWKISESKNILDKWRSSCTLRTSQMSRKGDDKNMAKQVNFLGQIQPEPLAEGNDIVGAKFLSPDGSLIALTFAGSRAISIYGK